MQPEKHKKELTLFSKIFYIEKNMLTFVSQEKPNGMSEKWHILEDSYCVYYLLVIDQWFDNNLLQSKPLNILKNIIQTFLLVYYYFRVNIFKPS